MQQQQDIIKPQNTKPEITRLLLRGKRPAELARVYNVGLVYKTYNELVASGILPQKDAADAIPPKDSDKQNDDDLFQVDSDGNEKQPDVRSSPNQLSVSSWSKDKGDSVSKGVETVNLDGQPTLPYEAVERIRNIMGISARPKVLNMPMPEMLYPAMVIAVTEMDFPPMRPEDFIDTVIYQWLEAAGYIPRAYIKRSELDKLIEKPTPEQENEKFKEWAKERGLVTPDELVNAIAAKLNVPSEKIVELFGDGDGDGHNGDGNSHHDNAVPEQPQAASQQESSSSPVNDAPKSQSDASPVVQIQDESTKNDMILNPKNSIVQITQQVNEQFTPAPAKEILQVIQVDRQQIMELFAKQFGLSVLDIQILDAKSRGRMDADIRIQFGLTQGQIGGRIMRMTRRFRCHTVDECITSYREFLSSHGVK